MQKLKKTLCKALWGAALILFAAGCVDVLQTPDTPEAKTGKVTLTIDSGSARTVAPGMDQFKKISLSFVGLDGTADLDDVDAVNGSAEVDLPLGSWTVTARAYHNAGDTTPAAQAENTLEYDGDAVKGETRFVLQATGTGPGILKYTVTVPNGVALANNGDSRIRIEFDGAAFADLDDDGFTDGERVISGSETKTVSLADGIYVADILLEATSGDTAVYRESVVIVSGLITELVFAPTDGDFVDPDEWAAMTDLSDQALAFGVTANDTSTDVDETVRNGSWALDIVTPAGAEKLWFTLEKTADYSVAIDAEDSEVAKTVAAANGSSAGDELAIVEVDLAAAVGRTVTLIITKEGMLGTPVEFTVTLTYTVSFDTQGGTPAPAQQTVVSGDKATEPQAPAKMGHALDGWFKDAAYTTEWDFATDTVTAGITLYAKWEYNFVAVESITGVPSNGIKNSPVSLAGAAAQPAGATNRTIVWSVKTPGAGVSQITGDSFTPSSAGTVTLLATIIQGEDIGVDYTKEFPITIYEPRDPDPGIGLPTYDSIVVMNSDGDPLPLNESIPVALKADYYVSVSTDYADIAWYVNGRKSEVTSRRIYLDTGAARTIKLSVEGKKDGKLESSGTYTFTVANN
jgi:uncharacterized repeat protein (TIGR02543 family)